MAERRSVFQFLVDINPVAKLYQKLLGVSDVVALKFAEDDTGNRSVSQYDALQPQVTKPAEEIENVSEEPVYHSATERYGDADHARRYGDYDAAHEIEKGKRRHFKID